MRAQATIEFLGTFLLTVAFFSILLAGMSALKSRSEEGAWTIGRTVELESAARALDVYATSDIAMIFDLGARGVSVQNSTVSKEEGEKVAVVEGVFNEIKTHREPV